jgi:hypothetical protein
VQVTNRILQWTDGGKLWIHPFSEKLFVDNRPEQLQVEEDFLERAGEGEWCFVECSALQPVEEKIEKLVVFRWNRQYPADQHLDLSLAGWKLQQTEDFPGKSHEKITEEVYAK